MEKKKPAPDGAGKEVSGVKIIIEADSKEIADLVLTLQGQQNQDEIAKNYAIDIFGNKYLNYESNAFPCFINLMEHNKKRPGQCTTTDQGMTPRTEATRYRRQYITSSGLWQDWRIFYDQRWTAQREQHEAGD